MRNPDITLLAAQGECEQNSKYMLGHEEWCAVLAFESLAVGECSCWQIRSPECHMYGVTFNIACRKNASGSDQCLMRPLQARQL